MPIRSAFYSDSRDGQIAPGEHAHPRGLHSLLLSVPAGPDFRQHACPPAQDQSAEGSRPEIQA
jgi:hypothetical protein